MIDFYEKKESENETNPRLKEEEKYQHIKMQSQILICKMFFGITSDFLGKSTIKYTHDGSIFGGFQDDRL